MTYCYPYRRGTGWRSQAFQSNRNKGANGPGGHTGFDQAMDAGTPLYAPGDGIIRNSSWLSDNYRDNGWWLTRMGGDTLVIDMVDSFRRSDSLPTFIFAHCSDTMAEVGQFVRKGELVALSGNTGTATTGPHVHIEALPPSWDFNNGVYGRVDPELYFDEWPDDIAGIAAMGSATIATTPPAEEDDMFTENDRAVLNSANLRADMARSEATNAKVAARDSVALAAQIQGLVGAIAALSKGEAFDQAKLLAGISAAAEAGVKAGIKDGAVSVDVTVGGK